MGPIVKNWTSTMSYAASKSSFRVFEEKLEEPVKD